MPKAADVSARGGLYDELYAKRLIDKHALDDCLVEQSDLFGQASEEYTNARSMQDEIKFDITQLEGELGAQFRSEADGDKKITDTAVRAMISSSVKMIGLQKELLAAATKVGKWAALKEMYEMRASMIKVAAQLYASNYFTVQTINKPRDEASERRAGAVREQAGEERRNRPSQTRLRPSRNDE